MRDEEKHTFQGGKFLDIFSTFVRVTKLIVLVQAAHGVLRPSTSRGIFISMHATVEVATGPMLNGNILSQAPCHPVQHRVELQVRLQLRIVLVATSHFRLVQKFL